MTDRSPCTTFDLATEARELQADELWQDRGLNTRTLLKLPDLRLVLIALKSGRRIERHQTNLRLNLTTFTGHVHLTVDSKTVDLPAGHVLVLDPSVPHDVEAVEDSVILLSLSAAG